MYVVFFGERAGFFVQHLGCVLIPEKMARGMDCEFGQRLSRLALAPLRPG